MLKFILGFSVSAINNWKLARDPVWPPAFGACVRICSMLSRCSFEKMPTYAPFSGCLHDTQPLAIAPSGQMVFLCLGMNFT